MSHLVALTVVTPQATIAGDGQHHVDAGSDISLECSIKKVSRECLLKKITPNFSLVILSLSMHVQYSLVKLNKKYLLQETLMWRE